MKRCKGFIVIVLCALLVNLSGCASIMGTSQAPVQINSHPDQASITIIDETGSTVYQGKTPASVTLPTKAGYFRGKNYSVTFTKDGFATYTAEIRRGVSNWYIYGNLVFGGLIGLLIVDPATGAMWTLQKEVTAELSPASASLPDAGALRIVTLDQVPASLRSRMVPIH